VTITGASAVMGSVWYMSPEQLKNSKHVDARTDIWALGVVLQELITGSRPFEGESAAAIGARIASTDPTRLRDVAGEAPEALEAVVLRCLERDPEKRFPDLASLARALAPFAAEGARPSVERIARVLGPHGTSHHLETGAPSRKPGLLAGVGIAIAGLAVLGGLLRRVDTPGAFPGPVASPADLSPSAAPSESISAAPIAAPAMSDATTALPPPPPAPTAASGSAAAAARPRPKPVSSAAAPSMPTVTAPASSTNRRDLDLRDPALEAR
jgi:serine/threonine-protein kinase